ncbi:hypothetical protein ACFV1F_27190 [Streptomyces sp. NPDC059590]|uniref:hypothetical protein n=1 Tax=unclassified Streptomyces TaxID=2593676 RepID=UPI0036C19137
MTDHHPPSPERRVAVRRLAPPPALLGFLVLLGLLFAASYAVGAAAGPVAPWMRPSSPSGTAPGDGGGGGDEGGDGGGGMHGMAARPGGGR